MEQQSEQWLNWRREGIGSSESPVVMGVSPWKTKLQLYREKIGEAMEGNTSNWATERGNRLEPEARVQFENLMQEDFRPEAFQHPEYTFIRASLDGWNEGLRAVLEIKCPGERDHLLAAEGKIPEKYIWQLEHQAFVTGARVVYYYSFDKDEKGIRPTTGHLVEYIPQKDRQEILLNELKKFWFEHVQKRIPPEYSKEDIMELKDEVSIQIFTAYKNAKKIADDANEVVERFKEQIIHNHMPHNKVECCGVKVTKTERKTGTVSHTFTVG